MDGASRYVMVPVPRAHVLDVMRWLVFRTAKASDPREWDGAALGPFLESLDPLLRSLVEQVAQATAEERVLRLRQLAEHVDRPAKVVGSEIFEVNRQAREAGFVELIIVHTETEVDDEGESQPAFRLEVPAGVARTIAGAPEEPEPEEPEPEEPA